MASASSHPGLAFPKGRTRRQEKQKRQRMQTQWIRLIRQRVWERSRGWCEAGCGTWLGGDPNSGELHESPSRAKTRGLPMEQRWNMAICKRLCRDCHRGPKGVHK